MQNSAIMAGHNDWQRPARTEEWTWFQLKTLKVESPFFQFISFPWATLIDLKRRNHTERADNLREQALNMGPKYTLIRATICQHIWALDLLPLYKQLGITDLFWPHAIKDQMSAEGIRLHPYPLFPVRGYNGLSLRADLDREYPKDILFNFIGAYNADVYLTPVRKWILDIEETQKIIIKGRDEWHYERNVYQKQIMGLKNNSDDTVQRVHEEEYDKVLSRSLFTLCPSGSGPNSIRFWEALMFGSIPVLLSDKLRLPDPQREWNKVMIQIPETQSAVEGLAVELQELAKDKKRIEALQKNIQAFRDRYILKAVETLILPLTDMGKIEALSRAV